MTVGIDSDILLPAVITDKTRNANEWVALVLPGSEWRDCPASTMNIVLAGQNVERRSAQRTTTTHHSVRVTEYRRLDNPDDTADNMTF